jgi:hypothetical protein
MSLDEDVFIVSVMDRTWIEQTSVSTTSFTSVSNQAYSLSAYRAHTLLVP